MADTTEQRHRATTRAGGRSRTSGRAAASWSPMVSGSTYDADEDSYWLDREITLLERALKDKGEMKRGELGELVGCKYWGPRRFARALKAGAEQGRIEHTGFGRYGPTGSASG